MLSKFSGSSISIGKAFIVMLYNGLTGCQSNSGSNSSFAITGSTSIRLNFDPAIQGGFLMMDHSYVVAKNKVNSKYCPLIYGFNGEAKNCT